MSDDTLARWHRWHEIARREEARLRDLGLSKEEAHRHFQDELSRSANRARAAGAKLREIGEPLGVGRERARQLANRGERLVRVGRCSPLERLLERAV